MNTKTGLDLLSEGKTKSLDGKKIGLVAHPASVNKDLIHIAEILKKESHWKLVALFGPQHGWLGDTQDNMIEWEGGQGYRNIPLYSLYGEHREPTKEMLAGLDALVFDLQDVGCRVYTFIQTLYLCMKAAHRYGKEIIVIDRPNPITSKVAGPMLNLDFKSFVGFTSIPLRHGKTIGELAKFYHKEFPCKLTVLEMENYNKNSFFDETALPWIAPSPNMPTLETALVYCATVLLEATNISEGRGTTKPFEILGAPGIDAEAMVDYLNKYELPGVKFRPLVFTPTFHKFKEQQCNGLQIHITNRNNFKDVLTGTAIIKSLKKFYSGFSWLNPPYEYEYEKMPIDILIGSSRFREWIDKDTPLDEFENWYKEDEKAYIDSSLSL